MFAAGALALPFAGPARACFPDDGFDDFAGGSTASVDGFDYSELGGGDSNAPAWMNSGLFMSDPAPDPGPLYSDPGGGGGGEGGGDSPPPDAGPPPDPGAAEPPSDPSPPPDDAPPPPPDPPPSAPDPAPPDPTPDPAPEPAPDPAPIPPPPAAPTASLSASPANGTAPFAAMIAWATANADAAVVAGYGLASSDLSGAQSVLLGAGGSFTFTITASGPGGQVSQAVTVTAGAARLPQSISFAPPATSRFPGAPLGLGATATSGLPVGFAVLSGPATIQGAQLTLTGTGPLVVRASQPGNAFWLPAPDVTATINAQPPPDFSRIRFNAAGRDAHMINQGAAAGSTFIWTDPGGLLLSPWPAFSGAQPAPAGPANTVLPPVPAAGP